MFAGLSRLDPQFLWLNLIKHSGLDGRELELELDDTLRDIYPEIVDGIKAVGYTTDNGLIH